MQLRFGALVAALGTLVLLAEVVTSGQDSDLEAFRKLHNELRERMNQDIAEATKFLDSQIAASPASADLNVLRHSLASRFLEQREFDEANAQFSKLLDFQIKHVDQTENQFGIWMTIQSMQEVADKSRNTTALQEAVNRGIEALTALGPESDPQPWMPLSQLAVLKAQLMADEGKADEGTELVQLMVGRLTEVNESETASEQTMKALVGMLRSLTTPDRGNDSWRDDYITTLDKVVSTAIERYPESLSLQNDYASIQFLMITRWGQDDPKATESRIEAVTKKLNLIASKNRSVQAALRRIELHKERMAAVKPVASLVGKPAPEWEIDAWVNAVGLTRDSFKGQVVLIDFWAMWCGPCIATFPHLREWRAEFADQGFEIIGVTKYYNFAWDDEQKRASRSGEDVPPEDERKTLASFLKHHNLEHPVLVTPEQSKMGSEYGVRGIPHVVLIDREGVVQLVKTGAGESTAREIHAKIKELVEEDLKQ